MGPHGPILRRRYRWVMFIGWWKIEWGQPQKALVAQWTERPSPKGQAPGSIPGERA